MRDNIVAITATEAFANCERFVEGETKPEVAAAVMVAARQGMMAPTDDEAFAASISALIRLYPDDKDLLLAEARSIGDRAKLLNAAVSGVPVDWSAAEQTLSPVPDGAWGLMTIWRETEETE